MEDKFIEGIRKVIRTKEIKLETISRQTGISGSELSKILNGKRQNYHKHLPTLMKAIGFSIEEAIDIQLNNKIITDKVEEEIDNYKQQIRTQKQLIETLTELCSVYRELAIKKETKLPEGY